MILSEYHIQKLLKCYINKMFNLKNKIKCRFVSNRGSKIVIQTESWVWCIVTALPFTLPHEHDFTWFLLPCLFPKLMLKLINNRKEKTFSSLKIIKSTSSIDLVHCHAWFVVPVSSVKATWSGGVTGFVSWCNQYFFLKIL